MIVKCINKKEDNHNMLEIGKMYCVISLLNYNDIYCEILLKNNCYAFEYGIARFPYSNFTIIDAILPCNYVFRDMDMCIFLSPLSYTNLAFDNMYQNDNIGFINAVNEILAFHNWPLLEIPDELLPQPTEEERRQKRINDELDEYLRIGEELEKQN